MPIAIAAAAYPPKTSAFYGAVSANSLANSPVSGPVSAPSMLFPALKGMKRVYFSLTNNEIRFSTSNHQAKRPENRCGALPSDHSDAESEGRCHRSEQDRPSTVSKHRRGFA